jgi:hypothetical protein
MNRNQLSHVGVLGMRWGTHRGSTNILGTKRLSISEREQKRRDVTKKLVTTALIGIGGYAIGSAVQSRSGDKKFAAAQKRGSQHVKKILQEARAGNRTLDASFAAMKAQYPRVF